MRDTSKPANGIRQDKIVITHYSPCGKEKLCGLATISVILLGTWAEDMAPQGCDQSADPVAGMRGRR